MTTPIATKLFLKSTTKMSLNERFTAYRAEAQSSAHTYRQKMQRQASSANLRLAQQMANRPTVIAALRLKKRSLQQRLGRRQQSFSNVKARLNLGGKRLANNSLQGRLGAFRGRGGNRRGGFKPGTSPLLKARLGPTRSFNYNPQQNQRMGGFRKRGNFQGGNRQARIGNRLPAPRNMRGGRNNRGGGGRGRGDGRLGKGRWGKDFNAVVPTKQELDNQLDEYMAETKGSLDAQIGHYMSQN